MFVFIGGAGPRVVKEPAGEACPRCDSTNGLESMRVDTVFSAFFIPVWTISKGEPSLVCKACGYESNPLRPGGSGGGGGTRRRPSGTGTTLIGLKDRCLSCGEEMLRGFNYCPFCGAPRGDSRRPDESQ